MGFILPGNSVLTNSLKQAAREQQEAIQKDTASKKWFGAFAMLLQKRETSGYYDFTDSSERKYSLLIETLNLRDSSYTRIEFAYRDTLSESYSVSNSFGDPKYVYRLHLVPLQSGLSHISLERPFHRVCRPYRAIGSNGIWIWPESVHRMYYYTAGKRKPSKKEIRLCQKEFEADLAGTILFYTVIENGVVQTSVQFPPAKMPQVIIHPGRVFVDF